MKSVGLELQPEDREVIEARERQREETQKRIQRQQERFKEKWESNIKAREAEWQLKKERYEPTEEEKKWLEDPEGWFSDETFEYIIPQEILSNELFVRRALQTTGCFFVIEAIKDTGMMDYDLYVDKEIVLESLNKDNIKGWLDILEYKEFSSMQKDKDIMLKMLSLDVREMREVFCEGRFDHDEEFMKEVKDALGKTDFEYLQEGIQRRDERDREIARKEASRILQKRRDRRRSRTC